ncbi:MAG: excinuclease ABC subunit UvrA [Rhodothermales bacterium]|nr:excinuclease ABC subunit UvrA [Rhodothermales bacterium]MBO6778585.1 excinuclease ABC subunit UvrA [Rhodothermales bacterium]
MEDRIVIQGAREHNLQNISLEIPRNELVVITGLSGSGKSSLAFDTIYAEGQRRYMESLSAYARQFLGMMERPDVDHIDGLSPVIAIEQKTVSRNPRSTVGTVTEIYDFLRLLFARASDAYSWKSGAAMRKQSDDEIVDGVMGLPEGTKVILLAPVVKGRKGHYRELFQQVGRQGFERVRIDGELTEITAGMKVDRYKTHDIEVVVDRLVVKEGIRSRVSASVDTALGMGGGTLIASIVSADGHEDRLFSRHLFSPDDGLSYDDPSPNTFSFNSPYGACPDCNGLGMRRELDPDLIVPNPDKTIAEGGIAPLGKPRDVWIFSQLRAVAEAYDFDFDTPFEKLSEEQQRVILEGAGEEQFDIVYKYKDREVRYKHRFTGVHGHIWHTYEQTSSNTSRKWAEGFMRRQDCSSCGGGRLKPESLSFRIGDKNIAQLARMDLASLRAWFDDVEWRERQWAIARQIVKEICERLDFLLDVGVGYLSLDRTARTLSGGESQRIRLATQIGTQLTGVLYVLDEPSIGLHARDNARLIASLKRLRDLENSVLVVEHDREMIEEADFVVDLGPGAGEHGGRVLGAAPPAKLPSGQNGESSLTTAYLRGEKRIALPAARRTGNGAWLELEGARGHNLQEDLLRLPLGTLTCVTGVSGSGKSSLINQTLYPILANHFFQAKRVPLPYREIRGLEHIDKVIDIDQSPIGRTPRSNPATYSGLFSHIRDLFAQLPEAQIRGYKPGRFSFNVKGGRCETCKGAGIVKLEMNFLPDVYVECETCKGRRYNLDTLDVRFKGKSIADVLEMTVSEALVFFENVPRIERKLRTLHSVGLGYIRLGQQATTLSGGEAQRVKLAKELSRPGTGQTLYILDEPTTGLHFEDIRHLLTVLQALVRKGNTVLVIEHNMDVVKVADYVIDLGPDGGSGGGRIQAAGTPEELAGTDTHTGRYLKVELDRELSAGLSGDGADADLDLDALASDDEDEPEAFDDEDEAPELEDAEAS